MFFFYLLKALLEFFFFSFCCLLSAMIYLAMLDESAFWALQDNKTMNRYLPKILYEMIFWLKFNSTSSRNLSRKGIKLQQENILSRILEVGYEKKHMQLNCYKSITGAFEIQTPFLTEIMLSLSPFYFFIFAWN